MSYVDAIHNRQNDTILVVERENGNRYYKSYPTKYTFYYSDAYGSYTSLFGEKLSQVVCMSTKEFQQELKLLEGKKIFESDINPVFQCLAEHYTGASTPVLNLGVFDIEVDFDPLRGYADPWDPFAAVTAISLHLGHLDELITLALPPSTITMEEAKIIGEKYADEKKTVIICNSEEQLLEYWLDFIEDVDVLTGWNSTEFDIPYLINRIDRVLGSEATRRMCLWNRKPTKRKYTKYKKEKETYDLVGRVHIDYLDLYKKHNQQELHSYRLDYVGEIEVGENKIPYEGTLDTLYKKEFGKFIEYNQQDTILLMKIDKKKKFIELANQIAHTNTVLLKTTKGSVALIEQAIINEAHNRGLIVPNRKDRDDDEIEDRSDSDEEEGGAVGAYVADPKQGLHRWIACCDINSLYPSCLRSLNMGPETLVGQIKPTRTDALLTERLSKLPPNKKADAWLGLFSILEYNSVIDKTDELLTVDFEDGTSVEITGAQLYDYIFNQNNPFTISANGTIFRTDKEAVIPGLLARWYAERKQMQAKAAECEANGDKTGYVFWDQRQHARKILLNSLYGAILNPGCRFYDHRIGQSVTLTGRSIVRHMTAQTNSFFTDIYDYLGDTILYNDTDSQLSSGKIYLDIGEVEIEKAFLMGNRFWNHGDKEYAALDFNKVLTYDPKTDKALFKPFNYVYRHKVTKQKWKITDEHGNQVTVTGDHSVMVERNGELIEVKPRDIKENDILITVKLEQVYK
jgi:DNA polymerase elongation subunit (family B)